MKFDTADRLSDIQSVGRFYLPTAEKFIAQNRMNVHALPAQ